MTMRIICTKIYRAFPELDRFDDARCERFIQAARRAWGLRIGVLLLCILVGAAVVIVPPLAIAMTARWIGSYFSLASETTFQLYLVASVMSMIAGPVVGFLTRDALLRRRVRYVLRARGTCLNCHYSLVGLPIGPDLMVMCPECQFISEVDEAMGELSPAADGTNRYAPNPINVVKPFFSERTRKWWRRFTRIVLPCVALLIAVGWGGYEFFLWRQAKAALALKPGSAGLLAYAEKLQPTQAGTGDAWVLYTKARDKRMAADAVLQQVTPPLVDGKAVFPEFSTIYASGRPETISDAERELMRVQASEAARYLDGYAANGVWEAYDAIAIARHGLIPLNLPPGAPAFAMLIPEMGELRGQARLLAARLTIAARNGNGAEIAAAYRTLLALARLSQMQTMAFQYLVGVSIEMMAHERIRSMMLSNPEAFDAKTLGLLLAAGDELQWTAPATHPWEGERLYKLDTAAWVFSSASRVRFGKYSPPLRQPGGIFSPMGINELPDGHLGTLAGVETELQEQAQLLAKRSNMTIAARIQAPPPDESSNVLLSTLGTWSEQVLRQRDSMMLVRHGTAAMLLIERFRREQGRVPKSLKEACGETRSLSLLDPFSGNPLLYKTIDPSTDRLNRPYLLYGVGGDLSDDGGKTPSGASYSSYLALTPQPAPTTPGSKIDYVINDDR